MAHLAVNEDAGQPQPCDLNPAPRCLLPAVLSSIVVHAGASAYRLRRHRRGVGRGRDVYGRQTLKRDGILTLRVRGSSGMRMEKQLAQTPTYC